MDVIYRIRECSEIEEILFEFKGDLFDGDITDEQLRKLAEKFSVSAVFQVLRGGGSRNIGYGAFYCNDHVEFKAFLSMLVIKDSARHRGAGSKLLGEAVKTAKREGMYTMALEVAKANDTAHRFYRKHGFLVVEDRKESYLMEKKLI